MVTWDEFASAEKKQSSVVPLRVSVMPSILKYNVLAQGREFLHVEA
ncbi:MAG: hypothetical protein HY731_05615 [Candidatus Tectomicrobia bacterium]|nr:hypothetical protein [Candidatus Tectomicrobia bacterium]